MVGLYGGEPLEYQAINEQGTEAVPASTGDVLGAAFGQGLAANLFPRGLRSQGRFTAETGLQGVDEFGRPIMGEPEPTIDPETANAQYGIKGVLSFDMPVPRSVAQDLFEHKRDELQREDTIARREGGLLTGGVARMGANFAAGLLDPINLAAGFIPFVGEERVASLLGRGAIEAMGAGERAGVRALTGAGQGAASMAALQPLEFGLSRGEQEDYTMTDALRSIAVGGLLGGGLHAVGGAVADRATGRYSNPLTQQLEDAGPEAREGLLQGALAQTIEGRPVEVAPALDLADALRAEQDLGVFIRQQQRMAAEADRAVNTAAASETRAGEVSAQIDASTARLSDLRTQAAATRSELEALRGTEDTITPERLQAVEAELAQPGLPATRREALEAERRLLTEGTEAPELEASRTEAQARGMEAVLSRQERAVAAAERALARQQQKAPRFDEAGFNAQARALAAKQDILQATVERELRRIAGRNGVQLSPEEVSAMGDRILAATPQGARDTIWPILGEIAARRSGRLAEAVPPVDISGMADPAISDLRARQNRAISEMTTRREPADALQAKADADAVMARPSDELQAIHQQIADLEKQAPPLRPEPEQTTAPEIIGREEMLKNHTDAQGYSNLGTASDDLAARVQTALDEGRAATLYAEGKAIPIVGIDRGQMVDAQGQKWGTIPIATDKGGRNRVEIAGRPKQEPTSSAKPQPTEADLAVQAGEARSGAIERAAFCISRGFG